MRVVVPEYAAMIQLAQAKMREREVVLDHYIRFVDPDCFAQNAVSTRLHQT